jgi:hypothetical protein
MATLTWFNQDNSNLSFSLEFEEQYIEPEFSELVFGLIENAHGYDERKYRSNDESRKAYQRELDALRESRDSVRAECNVMREQLDNALQELVDAKLDKRIHLIDVDGFGVEENRLIDLEPIDLESDLNNMGDKAYAKPNV